MPEAGLVERFELQLIEHFAQKKLLSRVERSPTRVAEFFRAHQMRYATPAKLTLKRLLLPASFDYCQDLGRARVPSYFRLDAGHESLETLAARLGGEVAEIGPVTAAALEREDPTSLQFAFALEPGEHSPAYTTRERATIFQVVDRVDPQLQALALVS